MYDEDEIELSDYTYKELFVGARDRAKWQFGVLKQRVKDWIKPPPPPKPAPRVSARQVEQMYSDYAELMANRPGGVNITNIE